jgi:hypothetical protein
VAYRLQPPTFLHLSSDSSSDDYRHNLCGPVHDATGLLGTECLCRPQMDKAKSWPSKNGHH